MRRRGSERTNGASFHFGFALACMVIAGMCFGLVRLLVKSGTWFDSMATWFKVRAIILPGRALSRITEIASGLKTFEFLGKLFASCPPSLRISRRGSLNLNHRVHALNRRGYHVVIKDISSSNRDHRLQLAGKFRLNPVLGGSDCSEAWDSFAEGGHTV